MFYRIDKCQTVKFTLASIDRRVDDPAAPTGAELNPPPPRSVAVIPDAILGTHASRLQVAQQVNASLPVEEATPGLVAAAVALRAAATQAPIPAAIRAAALAQMDADLQAAGLIDQNGAVTAQARQDLGWEHTLRPPTPGVLVKGCLGDCTACEPARQRRSSSNWPEKSWRTSCSSARSSYWTRPRNTAAARTGTKPRVSDAGQPDQIVMAIFPRACPSWRWRMASGTPASG